MLKITYIKFRCRYLMQVEEHALDAMHRSKEQLNQNSERLTRDKDFAAMGWSTQCCIKAVRSTTKTAKDGATTKMLL